MFLVENKGGGGIEKIRRTASLCEERNSVTAAGDDDGVLSSHQQTWVEKTLNRYRWPGYDLAWIATSSDEVWLFVAIGHHRHVAGRREHWYDGENKW